MNAAVASVLGRIIGGPEARVDRRLSMTRLLKKLEATFAAAAFAEEGEAETARRIAADAGVAEARRP
jgi:hypothetical protein